MALVTVCIHWFNPFVWIAFCAFSKDMEMSCDETVLRKLSEEEKKDYLASLLQLATGKKLFSGASVAFGEGDTKSRIINATKWKKPSLIISLNKKINKRKYIEILNDRGLLNCKIKNLSINTNYISKVLNFLCVLLSKYSSAVSQPL